MVTSLAASGGGPFYSQARLRTGSLLALDAGGCDDRVYM